MRYKWHSLPLWLQDGLIAALFAGIFSGIPSTLYAFFSGGDIYKATLAAGSILIGPNASFESLIVSAVIVHSSLSIFWATLLSVILPKRFIFVWAIVAAAGIAILDLLIIGQMFPLIEALSFLPQLADHIAFGGIVGVVLYVRHKMRNENKYAKIR